MAGLVLLLKATHGALEAKYLRLESGQRIAEVREDVLGRFLTLTEQSHGPIIPRNPANTFRVWITR